MTTEHYSHFPSVDDLLAMPETAQVALLAGGTGIISEVAAMMMLQLAATTYKEEWLHDMIVDPEVGVTEEEYIEAKAVLLEKGYITLSTENPTRTIELHQKIKDIINGPFSAFN